ncbi:Tetracycline resistance protein, class B [Sporomusa ovata DSM 2662]|uniref:Major facilitator family transporter n=1 Tax=Sporomusa ovata TaxID=2378 RepID=A0A0U1KZY0_9FIRM|nr:MFS transporter [Sporomusa ovata]EQB27133.1 arabinose efflux permease [Sporomusa ovata DSM 2662]CQR72971.1 Major facilitator family transporter [Sporomusa ovata]
MENTETLVREKLWIIPFILIITVNFLTCVGNFMLLSTLPILVLHIGGSKLMAGLITGIYSLTAFISRLQIGPLLDRKGRTSILIAGLSLLLIITASYNIVAYSVILLLMLRAIHGIGWSTVTTSTSTIASDLIPAIRRSEGMGLFGISISVAMVVGPGLGLYIMEHYGYASLFILSAGFIILALITGFSASYCRRNYHSTQLSNEKSTNTSSKQNIKLTVIEKSALYPSFLFFIIVTTYSTIMIFLPPYASDRGITNIGAFFTVTALAMMFTRLTTGRIADRYGTAKVVVPGMFLLAIALQILSASASLPMFLFAALIYGLGYGSVQPALNALAISLAPAERRGTANATFLCAQDMGGIIGSVIWGIVAQTFGFSYIYSTSAILIVVAVIWYCATTKCK